MLNVFIRAIDMLTVNDVQRMANRVITVTEKFDGTKLTFLKTGPSGRDWLLAYKGNILPRSLFESASKSWNDMTGDSAGVMQYVIPVDHMIGHEQLLADIPEGTEVLIEFIQRKPTCLRDYGRYHDMFVISMCMSLFHVDNTGTRLTTAKTSDIDPLTCESYRVSLGIPSPPVMFSGKLVDSPLVIGNKSLQAPHRKATPREWVQFKHRLSSVSEGFESALGGLAEGIVLQSATEAFKIVTAGQYERKTRLAKKMRWQCPDKVDEEAYWKGINVTANTLLRNLSIHAQYDDLAMSVVQNIDSFVVVPPRTRVNVCDDVLLTSKLLMDRRAALAGRESVGIVALAGKPIHSGHWKLIELAATENDRAIVYASTLDRGCISGRSMFRVWCDVLEKKLPKNVLLRFSPSPHLDSRRELASFIELDPKRSFVIYADSVDGKSLAIEAGMLGPQVSIRAISRESTTNISATQMRELLTNHHKNAFMALLPDALSVKERALVWDLLMRQC